MLGLVLVLMLLLVLVIHLILLLLLLPALLRSCSSPPPQVWRIPRSGLESNLTVPEASLPEQSRRVETVSWHPTAEVTVLYCTLIYSILL